MHILAVLPNIGRVSNMLNMIDNFIYNVYF